MTRGLRPLPTAPTPRRTGRYRGPFDHDRAVGRCVATVQHRVATSGILAEPAAEVGLDHAEQQRGLAGAADAREHGQRAQGQVDIDVLHVVAPGAADAAGRTGGPAADGRGMTSSSRRKRAVGVSSREKALGVPWPVSSPPSGGTCPLGGCALLSARHPLPRCGDVGATHSAGGSGPTALERPSGAPPYAPAAPRPHGKGATDALGCATLTQRRPHRPAGCQGVENGLYPTRDPAHGVDWATSPARPRSPASVALYARSRHGAAAPPPPRPPWAPDPPRLHP